MHTLYISKDPKIQTPTPVSSTKAVTLWMMSYHPESIAHMATPITYILDNYFVKVHDLALYNIKSIDTGGGYTVTAFVFPSGQVLTINDECVCHFNNLDDFMDGEDCIDSYDFNEVVEEVPVTHVWVESIGWYQGIIELNLTFGPVILINGESWSVSNRSIL